MRTWEGTEDVGDEELAGTLTTTVVLTRGGLGGYGRLRSWPLAAQPDD